MPASEDPEVNSTRRPTAELVAVAVSIVATPFATAAPFKRITPAPGDWLSEMLFALAAAKDFVNTVFVAITSGEARDHYAALPVLLQLGCWDIFGVLLLLFQPVAQAKRVEMLLLEHYGHERHLRSDTNDPGQQKLRPEGCYESL